MITKKQELIKLIENIPDNEMIQVFTDAIVEDKEKGEKTQQIIKIVVGKNLKMNTQTKALEGYKKFKEYAGRLPEDFINMQNIEKNKKDGENT